MNWSSPHQHQDSTLRQDGDPPAGCTARKSQSTEIAPDSFARVPIDGLQSRSGAAASSAAAASCALVGPANAATAASSFHDKYISPYLLSSLPLFAAL